MWIPGGELKWSSVTTSRIGKSVLKKLQSELEKLGGDLPKKNKSVKRTTEVWSAATCRRFGIRRLVAVVFSAASHPVATSRDLPKR
jgi:hypothetical protein